MTNTEAVGGFQFDIDAGNGLSGLNVTGVGSQGSAFDAGFTVSTNASGQFLDFHLLVLQYQLEVEFFVMLRHSLMVRMESFQFLQQLCLMHLEIL